MITIEWSRFYFGIAIRLMNNSSLLQRITDSYAALPYLRAKMSSIYSNTSAFVAGLT